MAQTIQIKRNNSNATTKPSSLLVGELAGNLLDRSLFSSDGSSVFQFYTSTNKWFDTSGNANNANKLGGVAASSYLTSHQDISHLLSKDAASKIYQTIINTSNKIPFDYISGKPTTLAGYGITDALPKNGGTITGTNTVPLYINTTDTTQCAIVVKSNNSAKASLGWSSSKGSYIYNYASDGRLGIKDDGTPYFGANTLVHSGNIGSQSVNSAKKLYYIGTVPSSGFDANAALSGGGRMSNYGSRDWWGSTMPAMSYGTIYQLQGVDADNHLAGQLAWDVNHANTTDTTRNLWWRANDNSNFANAKWHQIAFTDSNVASATKLQTARTIWGNIFDGTGNVSGNLILPHTSNIYIKNSNDVSVNVLQLSSSGVLAIGSGTIGQNHVTSIYGTTIHHLFNSNGDSALTITSEGNIRARTILPYANLAYNLGNPTNSWGRVFTRYIDTLSGYDLRFCAGGTEYMKLTVSNGDLHLINGGLVVGSGFKITASSLNIFEHTAGGLHVGYGLTGNYITQIYGGNGVYLRYGADRSYGLTISSEGHTKAHKSFEVAGNTYLSADVTITGQVKASGDGVFGSDARYKSKLQDLAVDIETIANAPVFSYKWTDRADDKVHLGTTAQYWLPTKFCDAVDTSNPNFYHLNYGALGVAIGVTIAKKVVNHEERILALERENKALKNELKQLRQWHN